MKKSYTLILCLAGAMLAGCSLNQAMPHTTITGSLGGKPFSFESPKDSDLTGLELTAETNGAVHVKIERLTAHTDATNIANSAAGQAAIVNAVANAVSNAAEQGAKIAGAAAGAAIKP